jgi:hypothetical protein
VGQPERTRPLPVPSLTASVSTTSVSPASMGPDEVLDTVHSAVEPSFFVADSVQEWLVGSELGDISHWIMPGAMDWEF